MRFLSVVYCYDVLQILPILPRKPADMNTRQYSFLFVSLLMIGVAFLLNWSWSIFDYDDGATIVYHMLGRNAAVQPPYSAYDSMYDFILSFVTPEYKNIFVAMMLPTLISALAVFIFSLHIGRSMIAAAKEHIYFLGFLFLLAIPDYIYLALSYKSNLIGLAFILGAHLLLLKKGNGPSWSTIIIAAVLFGFGATCRWNLVAYGLPLFADLAYMHYKRHGFKQLFKPIAWGALALLSFVGCLYISGYDINSFLNVLIWGGEYSAAFQSQLTAVAASFINFLTPAFILALLLGLVVVLRAPKTHIRLILFTVFSLPIPLYLGIYPGGFKTLLTLLPVFFIFFALGADYINSMVIGKPQVSRILFAILLLIPWFIGVRVDSPSTLWGPGYDMKHTYSDKVDFGSRLEERFDIGSMDIGFKSGFAITMAEGTRPLWGNAYVLYGGLVKQLHTKFANEAASVVAAAKTNGKPIYMDRINSMITSQLCRQGFTTKDSAVQSGELTIRNFTKEDTVVTVIHPKSKSDINSFDKLNAVLGKGFQAHFVYSSDLVRFIKKADKQGYILTGRPGGFSGIFNGPISAAN